MSLFITGTDTGVGKTRVAAMPVRALRAVSQALRSSLEPFQNDVLIFPA